MPKKSDDTRSPLFGLIRGNRGWYKHVPGVGTKYVASLNVAPTGADADHVWRTKFAELAEIRTVGADAMTIGDALDVWLNDRDGAGLSPQTLRDYRSVAKNFAALIGKGTQAGAVGESHVARYRESIADLSVTTRKNRLVYLKMALRWLARKGHVQPEAWGDAGAMPTKAERRRHKARRIAARGQLFYQPEELGRLIRLAPMAPLPLRLWVLLGINGALGQSDLDEMTRHHDQGDRLYFPRIKTGIERIVPLWPETRQALDEHLGAMPPDRDKLFTSVRGKRLQGAATNGVVSKTFGTLCDVAGVRRRGHYSLRRTFRTMTDGVADRHAVDLVMGHDPADQGREYVQHVEPARLKAVTDHVRTLVIPHIAEGSRPAARRRSKPAPASSAPR